MRFRWTIKKLQEASDAYVLRALVAERQSDLNPYAPLAARLRELYKKLDHKVQSEG